MTFPILGGNSAVAGYSIDNSLRFNRGDTAYLDKTFSSAGNRKTFTISFWTKRANLGATDEMHIFSADADNFIRFEASDKLRFSCNTQGVNPVIETNRVFRDVSSFYHIMYAVDTTQATASNRFKLYVNGVEETSFATDNRSSITQNTDLDFNNNTQHALGTRSQNTSDSPYDGYIAEAHFIDGQALSPTDFGEFDEDSGIWKPIEYTGSYGTNGFYLDFEDSGSLGADQSGNGNDFTPTNLASTDQTTDTPTNNWVVVNDLDKGQFNASYMMNLSEGNLKISGESESSSARASGFIMSTGKWYWEACLVSAGIFQAVGIDASNSDLTTEGTGLDANSIGYYSHTGLTRRGGTATTSGATWTTTGDIIGIAYDADNGDLDFYKNNVLQSNNYTGLTNEDWMPSFASRNGSMVINFGQDGSFAGNKTAQGNADGNGFGDFYYAPPSGYLALCTQNLATELSPTIDDGSEYFNTVLWTGDGVDDRSITGVGFQPDFLWLKERTSTSFHTLQNSNFGATRHLFSNSNIAEKTNNTNRVQAFESDGFEVGSDGTVNENTQTYVAWNWLANGGTTSSNTDGTITSTVQANTTAGFSIVSYTGTGSNATVGHGLSSAPKFVIHKNRTDVSNWLVWHTELGGGDKTIEFNLTNAVTTTTTPYNSTVPSSSVVSLGTNNATNGSGDDMIAYCFAEIEGYSKFGSGTGSGTASTNFIYTGFKPSWVMIKRTDSTDSWAIFDNKRPSYNVTSNRLFADLSNAESTSSSNQIDMVSNGFVARGTSMTWNASGSSFIYMAFAENPFVSSTGIPVTAR